ncbi:MAG: MBL fold metallo-hydrolase [Syntrophobacterales bacterium]|nr:MBL fold metallo-hydrolase [Syntrophobacterales bacterium]
MIVEHLVVGMLQTNCYILREPPSVEAIVIDPGGDAKRIYSLLTAHGLKLKGILLTHGHFDHLLDAWNLKKLAGGEIYLHSLDEPLLYNKMVGIGAFLMGKMPSLNPSIDKYLKDRDIISLGGTEIHVIETPGHTPGHVSFYIPSQKIIFVGDTLFDGSIGRTDFPGGSYEQLISSVRTKIFPLGDDTTVYPGHGPVTTVGKERRTNPFFL